jgi:hypothetical protein
MKIIFSVLFCFLSLFSFSQYSYYYNAYKSVDVNQKVSGNINTIDYGSLSLANAQRERTRLENLKYNDNREREICLEIASNPLKAFDYGEFGSSHFKDKNGFKKFTFSYKILHPTLFTSIGPGTYQNLSSDGINTQIFIYFPNHYNNIINIEDTMKFETNKVGEINEVFLKDYGLTKVFLHKKDLERTTVFGIGGFVGTRIWEDNYQYVISDSYQSFSNDNIRFFILVKYSGNKKDTNFEKLEGRKYYLRRGIEMMISSASITDYKFK